jgi:ubiquinone biosynthesis UbiH/UbiF/VisC/COQ6 family hydroxylase
MNFDLIIVGGGLAGAALAVALRTSRLRIALLDQVPPTRPSEWDTRIYAYSPANVAFLERLGVWRHLDHERLCAVEEMQVFGDRTGALRFSAYESGLSELAWIGESSLIHLELWESLKRQHNVCLLCPAAPAKLDLSTDGVRLELEDGRALYARLAVGADGRDSWVRTLAGIEAKVSPYQEKGVVANFRCEKPHRHTAFQWFRSDGILAWLPLPGPMMSMVWSAPDGVAADLLAVAEDEFCRRVAAAGGERLGKLELCTPRAAFPLQLMRVETMVKPRVALLGDAAHAIHPLSGHGINLGFQDANVLADTLAALPAWQDPGDLSVLRAYARARSEEAFVMQYATHALNRLFGSKLPFAATIRNLGLNLTDRLPVVTNALVRYAVNGKF